MPGCTNHPREARYTCTRKKNVSFSVFFIFPVVVYVFFCACASAQLYDRDAGKKAAAADSARIADSLRTADSIRVRDSLNLLSYQNAGVRIKKQREADSIRAERAIELRGLMLLETIGADSAKPQEEQEKANAARAIVVAEDHPLAPKIDSLSAAIAASEEALYSDKAFAKMRDYDMKNRLRYLAHLLRYAKKDTAEIEAFSELLLETFQLKRQRLGLLFETQEGENRQFISMHMKVMYNEMKSIGDYLLSLASRSRFKLERVSLESDSLETASAPDSLQTP